MNKLGRLTSPLNSVWNFSFCSSPLKSLILAHVIWSVFCFGFHFNTPVFQLRLKLGPEAQWLGWSLDARPVPCQVPFPHSALGLKQTTLQIDVIFLIEYGCCQHCYPPPVAIASIRVYIPFEIYSLKYYVVITGILWLGQELSYQYWLSSLL